MIFSVQSGKNGVIVNSMASSSRSLKYTAAPHLPVGSSLDLDRAIAPDSVSTPRWLYLQHHHKHQFSAERDNPRKIDIFSSVPVFVHSIDAENTNFADKITYFGFSTISHLSSIPQPPSFPLAPSPSRRPNVP